MSWDRWKLFKQHQKIAGILFGLDELTSPLQYFILSGSIVFLLLRAFGEKILAIEVDFTVLQRITCIHRVKAYRWNAMKNAVHLFLLSNSAAYIHCTILLRFPVSLICRTLSSPSGRAALAWFFKAGESHEFYRVIVIWVWFQIPISKCAEQVIPVPAVPPK